MKNFVTFVALLFVIIMTVVCAANGTQRIIAYGDWTNGITNLGISAVLVILLSIGWMDDK